MAFGAPRRVAISMAIGLTFNGLCARAEQLTATGKKHVLTVAEAVETTRSFAVNVMGTRPNESNNIFVSPDGLKYAVVLVTGDILRNGNWLEIITGSLDSLEGASHCRTLARLFLSSKGGLRDDGSAYITHAYWNRIQWTPDSKRITLLYSRDGEPVQVYAVDARSGESEQLTHAARNVVDYQIARDGALVYTALVPHSSEQSAALLESGFVVHDRTTLVDVLRHDVDGYTAQDWSSNVQRFISNDVGTADREITLNDQGHDNLYSLFETQFSPDGRYALIDGTPSKIDQQWGRYTQQYFKLLITDPGNARELKSLFIVDLRNASVTILWGAPTNRAKTKAVWSPDSQSILLGPTFIPPEQADAAGLGGDALAVVDLESRRFHQLPTPPKFASSGLSRMRWCSAEEVEIINYAGAAIQFRNTKGVWEIADGVCNKEGPPAPAIRVEIRQSMNDPPALYATDRASDRSKLILDFNPALRHDVLLGRVEEYRWGDREGRTWTGLLYYPVGYKRGHRYPLVIQTHGHAPVTQFSLYGPDSGEGLGPGGGPYAAQSLAGRGIAVLQMEDKDLPSIELTPREGEVYMAAYEAASNALTQAGIIDSTKVGLMGFSRTGFHVEYAIVHSGFPFAAALASDNVDGSYLQEMMFDRDFGSEVNGARPFAEGLLNWMRSSVGFNLDRVHTPLRLEVQNWGLVGVLAGWEVFDRLRRLHRPVEYYVIPDIEHGVHGVQNPRQCLASQEGAVDWFDFWLNGHEQKSGEKSDQYDRWHRLRSTGEQSSQQFVR